MLTELFSLGVTGEVLRANISSRSTISFQRGPVDPIFTRQEAQLSPRNRTAACLNFGKNISAKSVHLALLYVTALTSTNHHFTVLRYHVCT